MRKFTQLSLLVEPNQQVAMDIQSVIFWITFKFFAIGHVLFDFFWPFQMLEDEYIKTWIFSA